jgi:TPR repeat protein
VISLENLIWPQGPLNLGVLLATRLDPPELDQARHWWTRAAQAGHPDALDRLQQLREES